MSRPERLTSFFAVVTLPVGILAAVFAGPQAALVVFVVGWLLLVPATAVLLGSPGTGSSPEQVNQWLDVAERVDQADVGATADGDGSASDDPIEKLRKRYAAGEIDEVELERRLDALLDTEGLDPDDEEAIRDAVDRLDTGRETGLDTDRETELDAERE